MAFLGFYSIGKIPPLVLGLRFSPYRMEPPGLVRIPTGIIYIYWVFSRGYGFVRDLRVITGGFDAKVGFLQTKVDPMKLCMR